MALTIERPAGAGPAVGPVSGVSLRPLAFGVAVLVLVMVICASLGIGSRELPLRVVIDALLHSDGSAEHLVVTELRVPRTILGVFVGAALGTAGALIQAFTRNPLADPGVLGVNAGANLAIVLGIGIFGLSRVEQFLPFAFIGAIVTTVVVYSIARGGGGGATPLRLTLVGIALGAVLNGIASTVALLDTSTFDMMRQWGAGSLANRPDGTLPAVIPFIIAGLVLALLLARSLNAFALGDDLARTLGARVGVSQVLTVVAVTLLCGAATAAVGPISFIGLMVPHAVRWFTGPDQRWILPFTIVLSPALLLAADVVGRVVVRPGELQVGIVAAFVGAPVLIALVRRTRASSL